MSLTQTHKKKPTFRMSALSLSLIAAAMSPQAHASIDKTIENALKFGYDDGRYGQIKFNLRYRYEQDETDNPGKEHGDASTLRLRLGYLTPEFHGLKGFVEYEMNQDIIENDYNSTRNSKTGFEVIADPQEHELNQLWLSYSGIPDTEIKVGRQRIKIDNDRFIGNVGWRQLESTYDAVLITNKSLSNTTVKLGYINQVQTIQSFVQPMQTPFANISYNFKGYGKLTGYSYLIDHNEAAAKSSQTYGFSFAGGTKIMDNLKALYRVEYAYQKDYEDNPNAYEADYYHMVAGAGMNGFTVRVGWEQLDGSGAGKSFQTPLATAHAFNGWSDQFLSTPGDGIRDIYIKATAKIFGLGLVGMYHEFDDDTGSTSFGKEYDFQVLKKFGKHYALLAKYAYFDGDNGRFDAQNFWLQAQISY